MKPRIPPLPEAQWAEAHRQRITTFLAGARPGNGFRTLLNVPDLVDRTMTFHNYITQDSSLSPRVRELLILRSAWLHGSDVIWRERVPFARKAGLTNEEIRNIARGPGAGWDPFEANLLAMADHLFRNSFVNDAVFNQIAARYNTCSVMDAGMTVADTASLALLFSTLGVQPDEAPAADRMPMDVAYKVDVPQREAATLKAPRAIPMPGTGGNNPRTFGLCPKLAAARNGSGYVNQISMLGKTGRQRDRELLILRIGWNSQSEYEWSEHVGPVGGARKMGLPIERITMGPDAPGWDPFEASLLRFADEMYRDGVVSDRTWSALKQRYDDRMMIDATITVANYRMVSLALNLLGVQINPGEEKLPPVPPLAAAVGTQSVTAAARLPSPGFHHLHMNSVNPSAAIDAFMKVYRASTRVKVAGFEGIRSANDVTMLFTRVNAPPPVPGPDRITRTAPQTAFWHHVWSAPNARSVLARLRASDPTFDKTTFIPQYTSPSGETVDFSSDTFSGFLTTSQVDDARRKGLTPTRRGGYFNWYGPDGVVMETTDAVSEAYRIIGMFQEQPFCAVIWYQKHLHALNRPAAGGGATPPSPRSETDCQVTRGSDVSWPSTYKRGHYRVPPAQSVFFDDVQLRWYMNQENVPLASTRGQLLDHLALGVTNLDAWIVKLKGEGVTFLEQSHTFGDTRAVMIEGPGREAIELVERK